MSGEGTKIHHLAAAITLLHQRRHFKAPEPVLKSAFGHAPSGLIASAAVDAAHPMIIRLVTIIKTELFQTD